jgi:hypothetical protein
MAAPTKQPAKGPAKRPAKRPTRPPDQIVHDIHTERAGLSAAFDTLADELGKTVEKVLAVPPVAGATAAARTGVRWSAALRGRFSRRP